MPLQNRVTPFGRIEATAARGTLMGNRGGRIHDPDTKTLLKRQWASRRWISCVLSFKGRRRKVMGPGYTELFFLDEATALAAGHRPCFECRRSSAQEFAKAFSAGVGAGAGPSLGVTEIDRILHRERLARLRGDRQEVDPSMLPDGVMVSNLKEAFLCAERRLHRWTPDGYDQSACAAETEFFLLTPSSVVEAIRAGYRPQYRLDMNRAANPRLLAAEVGAS